MNTKKSTKINQLISQWPRGTVYSQIWLTKLGYYHDLVKAYKRNGWLETVGTGAFKLPNDHVDVYGGIFALQQQLQLPVHVGGRTALELKGFAHYGRINEKICFLFGTSGSRLPKWFEQYRWEMNIQFKATKLIWPELPDSLSDYTHKDFSIKIATPERAALEMLYFVPSIQGFDEARQIMEGLMTLRPKLVQQLLENCQSIKVKRLFLYFSEELALPWFEALDLGKFKTGSGKRVIVEQGQLNKKYLITVPRGIDH